MQDAYYGPEALDYACSVYVDNQTHTETYTLPLGAKFRIRVKNVAAEAVYTDRACTQPFGEEDGTGDLELYVP